MRVLWIGAGASIPAGYPSALALLGRLEEAATTGVVEEGVRKAWRRFADFRDSATGIERTLLFSPNPEVVLSLPDLLEAARLADDERIESEILRPTMHALRASTAGQAKDYATAAIAGERIEREYNREERLRLEQGRKARDALLHVLNDFFATRHYEDHTPAGYKRRDYLRRELAELREGDVVITTNWDTMIERTLLEEARWSPFDGYGFESRLTPIPPEVREIVSHGHDWPDLPMLPTWASKTSRVQVLKIHGSFGWRVPMTFGPKVEAPGRVYLDHAELLQLMPLLRPGSAASPQQGDLCLLWDEAEPSSYLGDRPLFIYPSYLKQIGGATLQQIWYDSHEALRKASKVRIIGASLPDADSAVRALLNPLRYRLAAGEVTVTVDDPSRRTHERWRLFLGESVVCRERRAGD